MPQTPAALSGGHPHTPGGQVKVVASLRSAKRGRYISHIECSTQLSTQVLNSSAQLKCSTQVLNSTAQLNWSSVQGSFLGRDDARQPVRHAWGPVGRGRSKARADMGPQQQRALSFARLCRSCCSRDPRRRRAESADDKPSEMGTRGSMTRRRR